MKVAILADIIERGRPISLKNYTYNFVKELIEIFPADSELYLIHGQEKKLFNTDKKNIKEIIIPAYQREKYKKRFPKIFLSLFYKLRLDKAQDFYRHWRIKKFCEKQEIDVLHIPNLAGAEAPSFAFLNHKFKLVVTLHGVSPLVIPREIQEKITYKEKVFLKKRVIKWRYFFKHKVDKVITVSESGKKNINRKLKVAKNKIVFIYHGVDHKNFKVLFDREKIFQELSEKYKINSPFILHVSSYQPKKNVKRIIKAFVKAKENYNIKQKLVIAGNQPAEIKELAKKLAKDDILFLGVVSHKELSCFYNAADIFIFPSLHESFGLPIIEAMACGCPVITSNVFACPEVAGDAAILVDPYSVDELAEAMRKIIFNKELKNQLIEKGLKRAQEFSWEKCACEHLKVYEKSINY